MQLKYVDTKEEIIAINRKSKHIEPHLHNALEIVCVTSGALELGVGQELYHMEKGDIGFVFPDVIHHYQVLIPGVNKATYLIASPFSIWYSSCPTPSSNDPLVTQTISSAL